MPERVPDPSSEALNIVRISRRMSAFPVLLFLCAGAALIGGGSRAEAKAMQGLAEAVSVLLRQGWEVHGPLLAVAVQKPRPGHVLYQPMLKLGESG